MNRGISILKVFLIGIAILTASGAGRHAVAGDDWRPILDLRGDWKFETGDDPKRAEVSFDDSKWKEIFVPAKWEYEGYPHYDGYGWYRTHFKLPDGAAEKPLYLRLGRVDDVAAVYFNGTLIGISGSFPPDYLSKYSAEITLPVPKNLLKVSGDNVIAVRVYDDEGEGGIVEGRVGLYVSKKHSTPEIDLTGMWKFNEGDSEQWLQPSFDDGTWKNVFVPAVWESQGYPEYDGMGWYRIHFRVPAELAGEKLVLVLGRIDDLDETFINGEEVGSTGRIRRDPWDSHFHDEYSELREYTIPGGLLKANADNVIAVRVFDGGGWGGIYEGPVGIMTRDHYRQWRHNNPWRNNFNNGMWNFFEELFD